MEVVLENPYILIHEKKISSMKDLVPVLEQVAQHGQAAADHRRGRRGRGAGHAGGQQAARHAAGRGRQGPRLRRSPQGHAGGHRHPHRRPAPSSRTSAIKLENVTLADLGRAKKIIIDKDNTTIIEGAGGQNAIKGRIEQIRTQIEKTTRDYDREKLEERLAKLAGGVADDQRRRRDRDRDEGEEGPRRGRPARDPGGRRRRHPARRRRGPAPCQQASTP